MEYWFYHLEQTSLEAALPQLLEKSLERGWRARVQFGSAEAMSQMNTYLWSYRKDSFLAHGIDTEPMASQQPILLSSNPDFSDSDDGASDIIFLVGGAAANDTSGASRCVTMVDSRDERGAALARERWQKAKADGQDISYWRQDEQGRWKKQ